MLIQRVDDFNYGIVNICFVAQDLKDVMKPFDASNKPSDILW